jgi:hypothetical protein
MIDAGRSAGAGTFKSSVAVSDKSANCVVAEWIDKWFAIPRANEIFVQQFRISTNIIFRK